MKEDLSAGNYAAAFQLYAADCDQMITRARDDNPFSEKDLPHESQSPLDLSYNRSGGSADPFYDIQ